VRLGAAYGHSQCFGEEMNVTLRDEFAITVKSNDVCGTPYREAINENKTKLQTRYYSGIDAWSR